MTGGLTGLQPGRAYRVGFAEYSLEKAWFCQFCIGILLCVNNGACFCFGIFSPYMKGGSFRYSQFQIDAVSTVGVLLSYFSVPTGFLYDRKGPAATLLVGTLLNTTGWAGMYLMFSEKLPSNVFLMAFFYGLSQFSASFFETGTVLTSLKSFSCYQGRVILIQKTFMGLGSSLVAQIHIAFFEKTFKGVAPFFVFLLLYSAFAGALGVRYLRLPSATTRCVGLNVEDADTRARGGGEPRMFARPFTVGSVILCFSVAFILFVSLIENYVHPLSIALRTTIGIATVSLCASFTAMIFTAPSYEVNRQQGACIEGEDPVGQVSVSDASVAGSSPSKAAVGGEDNRCSEAANELGSCTVLLEAHEPTAKKDYGLAIAATDHKAPPAQPLEQFHVEDDGTQSALVQLNAQSLWENLQHCELWLLWFVCFGAWGAMTVVSSNSTYIYQSMAGDSFSLTVNTVFVSIYGVASAVGRILVGALYPHLERRRIPVSVLLLFAPALNVIGLPLFLVIPPRALFVPFFLVGLGVGFSWGSTVLTITSLFITKNCGKHYSFLYTAGMLSPLIFNIALFGPLYDYYETKHGHGTQGFCEGAICIAIPLLVCMIVNILAVPSAYFFYKRTTAPL
ncbi:hypothetical protein JKF63_07071 [Porcisia hertigi]|uniref:Nodulin-like domain-containing protein n=1 Tax=Porcisia hertigi TaxID=2761500 RepID=A0A836IIF3_9TRYP|nr:hypothetical protein JKF63_07071 [Porcisia hertigi]